MRNIGFIFNGENATEKSLNTLALLKLSVTSDPSLSVKSGITPVPLTLPFTYR